VPGSRVGQPLRKEAGRFWRRIHEGGELDESEKHVPSVLTNDIVYHNLASSMGNIDPLRPIEYPVHPFDPLSSQKYCPQPKADEELSTEPTIRVINSWERLCPRPTELYLCSVTQDKKLSVSVSWDGNTYEDSVVEEWLKEVKLAVHHYLCQPL